MFFLYQLLIVILLILSPLIIGFRILKKKSITKDLKKSLSHHQKKGLMEI